MSALGVLSEVEGVVFRGSFVFGFVGIFFLEKFERLRGRGVEVS